jgi:hypothetical protein
MKYRPRILSGLVCALIFAASAVFAQMPGMGGVSGSGPFAGFDGHNMNFDLVLPQVAVGQHYQTSLLLLNMANTQVMNWTSPQSLITTGKVYFYKQDGTKLQVSVNGGPAVTDFAFSLDASKSASYVLSSTGTDTSGWGLIDVDEPASGSGWGMMDGQTITRGMRLMADVFYTYSGPGQPGSRVGVVPSMYEMGKFDTAVISAQSGTDLYTGVAIVNTSASSATVNLKLHDSNSDVLGTATLTIGAGNQVAKFINELFPSGLPANFQGYLEIDSGGEGIVTMGLLISQGILTSIPMRHYGQIRMM